MKHQEAVPALSASWGFIVRLTFLSFSPSCLVPVEITALYANRWQKIASVQRTARAPLRSIPYILESKMNEAVQEVEIHR